MSQDKYRVLYTNGDGVEKMTQEPLSYDAAKDKATDMQMDGDTVIAVITEDEAQRRMSEAEPLFRVKYKDRSVPGYRYTRRPMKHEHALNRAKMIGAQDGIVSAVLVPAEEAATEGDPEDPYFDIPLYLQQHRDVEAEVKDSLETDEPEAAGVVSLGYADQQVRHYSLEMALRLAEINKSTNSSLDDVLRSAESFLGFLLCRG